MDTKFRWATFALTVLLAVALSAMAAAPVLADGGTTPPQPTGRTARKGSSPTTTGQVPAGTKIVILDTNGNKVVMGTQEAEQILASGDPVWCPATLAAPSPGTGGCTSPGGSTYDADSLVSLLNYLAKNQSLFAKNGTIWIEASYNSGSASSPDYGVTAFTLDGDAGFGTMKNFSLTIQGGWIGTPGSHEITGQSEFDGTLNILHWNGNVTVNDVLIQNTTTGDALTISTTKNIVLGGAKGVEANYNTGGKGASLDNTSGTGTVTVNNSEFDGNSDDGLQVLSRGAIAVDNLKAVSNGETGAYLDNCQSYQYDTANDLWKCSTLAASGVTLSGNNYFDGNGQDGLEVYSNGAIAAHNLVAGDTLGNLVDGAYLDNCQFGDPTNWTVGCTVAGAPPVTLTGTNQFDNNGERGLAVETTGNITTNNLTAVNNGANTVGSGGVSLQNCQEYEYNTDLAYWKCSVSTPHTVTLTGQNLFEDNGVDGVDIASTGAITINALTASGNGSNVSSPYLETEQTGGVGAAIGNCTWDGGTDKCDGSGNVTLTGTTTLNGNHSAYIEPGIYDQPSAALTINSSGAISIQDVTSTHDYRGAGAWLDNCNNVDGTGCGTAAAYPVTVASGTFNGNATDGLDIDSNGDVALENITAGVAGLGNGGNGALVDNCQANYVEQCTVPVGQSVSLTGTNTFADNGYYGLDVNSNGNIFASNLVATDNGTGGIVLLNNGHDGKQNITLAGYTRADNNRGDDGLGISTDGNVAASNLEASGNQRQGVLIMADEVVLAGTNTFENNAAEGLDVASFGGATIKNVSTSGNGIGLYVDAGGPIAVYNITAKANLGGDGVHLDNCNDFGGEGCSTAGGQPVTLLGTNVFDDNHGMGLEVESYGSITTSNLEASGNTGSGVHLENDYVFYNLYGIKNDGTQSNGLVTLTGTNLFSGNLEGLIVDSYGAIKAGNVNAISNAGDGAYFTNSGPAKAQSITLTNSNSFSYNDDNGLEVHSNGAINVSSITADANTGGDGVLLDNCGEAAPLTPPCTIKTARAITLTGSDVFNGNKYNGLEINSGGSIAVNTTALIANADGVSGSAGSGVALNNAGAATPMSVTVNGTSFFDGDFGNGMYILSRGAITTNNITAINTVTQSGLVFDNSVLDYPGAVGSVTMNGTNVVDDDALNGVAISSAGAITVDNVTVDGNQMSGLWLDNCMEATLGTPPCTTPTAQTVILNNVVANNNGVAGKFNGIEVMSKGTIKAKNITASGNTGNGASLDNSQGSSLAAVIFAGANFFNANTSGDGLLIKSHGPVSLTKITANLNSADGLNVTTPSTLTLTCGTFVNNAGYGVNLDTGLSATLNGVVFINDTAGNTNQTGGGAPIITSTCTLP